MVGQAPDGLLGIGATGQSEAFQGGVWPNGFGSATSQVIWSCTDIDA